MLRAICIIVYTEAENRLVTFSGEQFKRKNKLWGRKISLHYNVYVFGELARSTVCVCARTHAHRALHLAWLSHLLTPCCYCSQAECPDQWQQRHMTCTWEPFPKHTAAENLGSWYHLLLDVEYQGLSPRLCVHTEYWVCGKAPPPTLIFCILDRTHGSDF